MTRQYISPSPSPFFKRVARPTAISLICLLSMMSAWLFLRRPGWDVPAAPTFLKDLPAEVFFLDASDIVRVGPKRIIVIRLLGDVDLVPHVYTQENMSQPEAIGVWAEKLQAPIVLNAGQFDAKRQYLGWLKGRGVWYSRNRKAGWMGLILTGPQAVDGNDDMLLSGQVLDLQNLTPQGAVSIVNRYTNVIQSMMLVDEAAQVRVRRSELAACRTVIAQDAGGRLLLIASEGAVTLYDLALWLTRSELRIVRAMNLDGGVESQLAIRTDDLHLTLYGQYGTESQVIGPRTGGAQAPLPMVIGVYPH